MIAKVFFAAVCIALVNGVPRPEPVLITIPHAAAPIVLARTVAAPVSARIAVAPVAQVAAVAPVATSTSSQYVTRTYNGVATYAVAAPVAPVVDTRARYISAAPSQLVVASAPQILVSPAQFVATPTATSSQVVTRSFNGLPTLTYYTVPTVAAAPVAVGVSAAPAAPVAPPTQSSTDVEVLDA